MLALLTAMNSHRAMSNPPGSLSVCLDLLRPLDRGWRPDNPYAVGWRLMKAAMPGTVKAITPCSGAYTRPLWISPARVGPTDVERLPSLRATSPDWLGTSPSPAMARM